MINLFKISVVFFLILGLIGCGGNTSSSTESSLHVETQKSEINELKDEMNIDFSIASDYTNNVEVKLSNLSISVAPCTVEQVIFSPSEITLDKTKNKQDVHAIVKFTESCTPTSYALKGTNLLSLDGKSNEVGFDSSPQEISSILQVVAGETHINTDSNTSNTDTNTSTTDTNTSTTSSGDTFTFYNIPQDIEISKPSSEYSFRVQVISSNKKAAAGKTLTLLAYDISYGEISNMSATTDSNGFATFLFTSAKSLEGLNDKVLPLKLELDSSGTKKYTTVNLKFNTSSTTSSENAYRFINPSQLSVEVPSTENISITLVDNNNVGVSGKELQITTLASKYGSIASSRTTTNGAGVATFSYTSPSDIESIDGESTSVIVTFTENDLTIKQAILITFSKKIENDNSDANNTLPIVVIENSLKTIELTSNSKTVQISIQAFKDAAPYSLGSVKVELPSKVLNGVDVGLFEAYEVPVNSQGIAIFNYTGPANLQALMDSNDRSSIFNFYHTENSALENRQELKVNYNLDKDSYTPIDYVLDISTEGDDFSMGIPDIQKTFSVLLKDSEGKVVNNDDINISQIEVSTENALVAKLINISTGVTENSVLLKTENNSPFILVSKKLSGIVPLRISIEFSDINNELKRLSTVVNVRVMSGPPSAISVSYVSTGQDALRAKYEEKFAVSVTDEYGNKVNSKPYISLGAIVGYTVDGRELSSTESNTTRRLFYGKNDISNNSASGEIDNLGDEIANTTNFEDNSVNRSNVFQWVNSEGKNSDKLVVFGTGKNYEAMGKWDFSKLNDNTLSLEDDYFGENRGSLYYAVGRNYYQDQCQEDGREWLGSTDSESYQLDDEGTVVVSYKYDYQLMGKDALIWVNLNGYQPDIGKNTRIGEVLKHTLRGTGLRSVPESGYSLDKNETKTVTFEIWQKDTSEAYRNARLGWSIADGSKCQVLSMKTSNAYDARTCNNGYSSEGRAYVTYALKAPEDKECSFNIDTLRIAHEF